MATLPPPNNGDNSYPNLGKEARANIIEQLSIEKQFSLRKALNDVDKTSPDQAREILRDAIVSLAYREHVTNNVMKMMMNDFGSMPNLPSLPNLE